MAYWMIACSVYLYIATLGLKIRICRISRVPRFLLAMSQAVLRQSSEAGITVVASR
jgi:hypothetical protein